MRSCSDEPRTSEVACVRHYVVEASMGPWSDDADTDKVRAYRRSCHNLHGTAVGGPCTRRKHSWPEPFQSLQWDRGRMTVDTRPDRPAAERSGASMGPRSDDRGHVNVGGDDRNGDVLQWGRGRMTVDTPYWS